MTGNEVTEVSKAAQEGFKLTGKVGGFVSTVFGDAFKESAGILQDKLQYVRWSRQNRLIDKFEEEMTKRNLEGKITPVPPKYAIPIIEHASLEEDDNLQDLWINLLTSMADPDFEDTQRSSYIGILKELEVIDVKALEVIGRDYIELLKSNNISDSKSPTKTRVDRKKITTKIGVDGMQYESCIDNLMRVRCITSYKKKRGAAMGFERPSQVDEGYEAVCLTSLGYSFLKACMEPSQTGHPSSSTAD